MGGNFIEQCSYSWDEPGKNACYGRKPPFLFATGFDLVLHGELDLPQYPSNQVHGSCSTIALRADKRQL